MSSRFLFLPVAGAILFLSACAVGPNYKRPTAPAPVAFKEQPPPGWKEAQPGDGVLKGKWWELYNDPALNPQLYRPSAQA